MRYSFFLVALLLLAGCDGHDHGPDQHGQEHHDHGEAHSHDQHDQGAHDHDHDHDHDHERDHERDHDHDHGHDHDHDHEHERDHDRDRGHDHDQHDGHNHGQQAAAPHAGGVEDQAHTPGQQVVFYPQKRQEAIRFSVERIAKRPFRASLLAFASVRLPGDVAQMVSAPVAGEIRLARGLHVGQRVERGDTVATIRPVLGQQADAGTLHLALKRAEAGLKLAEAEKARTEKLQTQNAISQKRLLEAEQNYDLALAEVAIAQKRLDQLQSGGDRSIGVAIKSTVEGRIVDQRVLSGAFVREGEPVLVISGDDKLWIQANLSSDDRHKMAGFGGIELRLGERALRYRVGQDATIISKGGVIDPKTRTVPVIFEVESAPSELPAGEVLPVRLFGLEERPYVAIPKSAVVNDGGVEVVYVQKDPEHFERREIETVLEDGDWVAIHAGVAEHERVVSEGAYRILLASFAPAELGHGHAH